jgi:hypothetical protein
MKDSDAKRLSKLRGISYVHALRLVRQARQHADQYQVSYPEAEQYVVNADLTASTPALPSFTQLLRDAVEAACMELAYQEVAFETDGRPTGGLPFEDVPLPHDTVDNISVEFVEPDLDTLTWSIDEVFEGGTQVGTIELTANVSFDGYVHKSVGYYLQDEHDKDIYVVDIDWNDQMSRVSFARPVALTFHGMLERDLPAINSLEFVAASDAGRSLPDPHV